MSHHSNEVADTKWVTCTVCKGEVPEDNPGRKEGFDVDLHGICTPEYKVKWDAVVAFWAKPGTSYLVEGLGLVEVVGIATCQFTTDRQVIYKNEKGRLMFRDLRYWINDAVEEKSQIAEIYKKPTKYRWACVSYDETPKWKDDLQVIKVDQCLGHVGPVTWDRGQGLLTPGKITFRHVFGPVRAKREEARADKKKYVAEHKLPTANSWDYQDGRDSWY